MKLRHNNAKPRRRGIGTRRGRKNSEKHRVGSGKLFAASKTRKIKRIHASPDSFDVHRLENAFATRRGIRALTSPRIGCCNIFRRNTQSMAIAVAAAALSDARSRCSVCARRCEPRIERYSVVRNSLIPTDLSGPGDVSFARFRELSSGRRKYVRTYVQQRERASAAQRRGSLQI